MSETSINKPIAAKEKKVTKPTKTKKKKVKFVSVNKTKKETTVIKESDDDEEEDEKEAAGAPQAPQNTTIFNVLIPKINSYAAQNDMSTQICFLVDMSLPSGKNRFFVFDLSRKSILYEGLVAHGSCNETFMARPRFSNSASSGCSSLGKYKVGEFYTGKYGKSFRLHGLDDCNSNAYKRAVVIHGYDCVPDQEIYPRVLCNSLGCVMVSYKFFDKLSRIIKKSEKPIILWVYQS